MIVYPCPDLPQGVFWPISTYICAQFIKNVKYYKHSKHPFYHVYPGMWKM